MRRETIMMLLLAGAALGQPGWDEVSRTVRVTLHDRVRVKGHELRLSDVAEVEGLDAAVVARARALRIGPVPGPGRARLLARDSVAKAVHDASKGSFRVELTGAAAVQVLAETVTLSAREVGTLARRFVFAALGWRGDGARVVPATRTPALEVTAGRWSTRFDVVAEDPAARLAGLVRLKVRAIVDGRPGAGVPVRLVIRRDQDVVVLKRRVPAGRPVRRADVAIEKRLADAASSDALSATGQLEGLITRRALAPGTILTRRDLRSRPVVFRNDRVTVRVRSGGLVVTGPGRVLESGAPGDVVPVRSGTRRRVVQARVIDSETVEILFQGDNR